MEEAHEKNWRKARTEYRRPEPYRKEKKIYLLPSGSAPFSQSPSMPSPPNPQNTFFTLSHPLRPLQSSQPDSTKLTSTFSPIPRTRVAADVRRLTSPTLAPTTPRALPQRIKPTPRPPKVPADVRRPPQYLFRPRSAPPCTQTRTPVVSRVQSGTSPSPLFPSMIKRRSSDQRTTTTPPKQEALIGGAMR